MKRRNFLKAGLVVAVGALTTKAALPSANKKDITPVISGLRDVNPNTGSFELVNVEYKFSIGKGKDFETLDEFWKHTATYPTDQNISFIGEVYSDLEISMPLIPNSWNHSIWVKPAPGKGFLDSSQGKAWDAAQPQQKKLAEVINEMANGSYYVPRASTSV